MSYQTFHTDSINVAGLRREEYDRILQAAADEEAYLRKLQADDVRRTWEEQMAKKQQQEPEVNPPTDFGIGHEDPLSKERVKAQKEQMARWAREQALQDRQRKQHERDEDQAYADMLRAVDDIRGRAEDEEALLRKEMTRKLREDNLKVRVTTMCMSRFERLSTRLNFFLLR